MPVSWATTQKQLGDALLFLGERDGDTTHLHEAVAAYDAALEERTRERMPLAWAGIQNNRGAALVHLGIRERDPDHLQKAVSTFHDSLEERTQARVPVEWAATQNNLGNALLALGELGVGGTEGWKQAVAAFRAALEERSPQEVPRDWAKSQTALGNALFALSEREPETEHLEEAVAVYRSVLTVSPDGAPSSRTVVRRNLAQALKRLEERQSQY